MAVAAVSYLLSYLRNLLVEETFLISGAETELQQLQQELQRTKDFLKDLEKKGDKGEVLRQFEREIREVVYNAEDVFDDFLTLQKSSRFLPFARITNRYRISKTLKAIREDELLPLLERARTAIAADLSATGLKHQHQRDAKVPFLREDKIVGFEDETELLIKYLKEESDELDVISIVGMPGLGKTTLARKIFLDPNIQFEFPSLIWIYVSHDFNIKDVYLTILKEFTSEDLSELTDSLLADIVRNNLENRRFLLLIDDVYSTEDWKRIEVALPKRNRHGKVLITTQDQKVAQEANYKRNPHRLRFLTSQESWELLQLEVFGALDKCPSSLEGHGKKIAMECDGLPLAIVVIGGILIKKFSTKTSHVVEEWEKVSSSLNTNLDQDKLNRKESIISLSYNRLPYELRDCFLYLGVFPADTVIPAGKLVRLWIAEGFIQPLLGKTLEEAAEDNLKDLVDRNLVMVVETKAGGGIKTCRLHDVVHEFCRNRAAFEQQNLFQEVKQSIDGVFHPPLSEIQKCRRLCIHSNVENFVRQKPKGPLVRSFLCFSREDIILKPEYVSAITESFDCLRVLDVSPTKFLKFPSMICYLTHLRYIALSGDNFNALPAGIFKLWNLQTIRIDTMSRTLEIKADIWDTINLRHLKTKAAIVMNKDVKGKGGQNLQTLTRLSIQSFSKEICQRVLNLKNFGICGNLGTLLNTDYLKGLDRLQKLKLLHDVSPGTTSENPMVRLPKPEAFPPNMRILTLSSTFLEWKHMDTLGMLPTLEILKLKANAFMGRLWEDGGLFPSLEVLLIEHADLEVWSASKDSFPRLRCIVLKNCQRLEEIPHVLAKTLQALDIERVSESAVISAKRIESMKKEMQDQKRAKRGEFKLRIWPGDEK